MTTSLSLSDEDLTRLAGQPESDRTERKESLSGDAPAKIREAICAFANDLPGHGHPGIVFVGIRDDGSPSGLPITDELLRSLADMKTDGNILPPPSLSVSRRTIGAAEVAVIVVAPSDSPPVRCRGRVWIRVGPRRGLATEQDERILNERRRHRDRPFDVQPVGDAAIRDLDRGRFENEYLPAAVAPDVLAANERTYEQRLASTKMLVSADFPTPTLLGVLVLAHRTRDFVPNAYIQFRRVAGIAWEDPTSDEAAIDGPISELIRRIEDRLASHNRTAVDFVGVPTEVRRADYPPTALQQIVRNAVMHRTYESTNAPVRVTWFDDRVEIASPGGPYGLVSKANFGTPGYADYRNPNLAEALRVLGFAQRFGAGIATARRELAANGNPDLEFHVEPTLVSATLRRRA